MASSTTKSAFSFPQKMTGTHERWEDSNAPKIKKSHSLLEFKPDIIFFSVTLEIYAQCELIIPLLRHTKFIKQKSSIQDRFITILSNYSKNLLHYRQEYVIFFRYWCLLVACIDL